MARAVLITGGNLGDIAVNMALVAEIINTRVGNILAKSSVMESEAWGFEASERFLNQVLVVQTQCEPLELLDVLIGIEKVFGRDGKRENWCQENPKYASRTMDIDILYYDDIIYSHSRLQIPHPKIKEREFVLAPLSEVMGDYLDPQSGKTILSLLGELQKMKK